MVRIPILESLFISLEELIEARKYCFHEELIGTIRGITVEGVKYLEERIKAKEEDWPKTAFVAQSFNTDILPYFDSLFGRSISECGYEPIIINTEEPERGIDSEILLRIEECLFMVVDLTLERPSVYLEAGYALGKGKKVFFTARNDHNTDYERWEAGDPKVHFDLRNYKITWWDPSNPEPAYKELVERIKIWLGKRQ